MRFNDGVLRGNPNVEQIPKATSGQVARCYTGNRAGKYHKTAHAPHLLAKIRPDLLNAAAPNCKRLFDLLLKEACGHLTGLLRRGWSASPAEPPPLPR